MKLPNACVCKEPNAPAAAAAWVVRLAGGAGYEVRVTPLQLATVLLPVSPCSPTVTRGDVTLQNIHAAMHRQQGSLHDGDGEDGGQS